MATKPQNPTIPDDVDQGALQAENDALRAQLAKQTANYNAVTRGFSLKDVISTVSMPKDGEEPTGGDANSASTLVRWRVLLARSGNAADPAFHCVQINGRNYQIRRGQTVDVPPEVVLVLDQAVHSLPIVDPDSSRVLGYQDAHRVPYQVMGLAIDHNGNQLMDPL